MTARTAAAFSAAIIATVAATVLALRHHYTVIIVRGRSIGFDPDEHEEAAQGAWITPWLLDRYGPAHRAAPEEAAIGGPLKI
jgi:hypothetical protein